MGNSAAKTVFKILITPEKLTKTPFKNKNLRIMFFVNVSNICNIFGIFCIDLSASFQYFLTYVSALKFPLNATEYYA